MINNMSYLKRTYPFMFWGAKRKKKSSDINFIEQKMLYNTTKMCHITPKFYPLNENPKMYENN